MRDERRISEAETLDQLRALHRAALAIAGDLELDQVLRRIPRTARALVRARYGALGVPDPRDGFSTFITIGIADAQARRIGALPRLHGILGALVRERRSIRVNDIRKDPRFSGYPRYHPVMRDFLGVPIRHSGEILGNLYLSGAPAGRFGPADQRLVEMLADHAGVAILTARRYRQEQERVALEERDRLARVLQEALSTLSGGASRHGMLRSSAPAAPSPFTPRESEVLRLMVDGLANKEIAGRLLVSEKTIKTHVSNILQKLGVADRTQAAVLALRKGLID